MAAIITRAALASGWQAAALKPGMVYGESDEFGYNMVRNPVHVHDFHATVLNQLGIDHTKLTFKSLGPQVPAHRCGRKRSKRYYILIITDHGKKKIH